MTAASIDEAGGLETGATNALESATADELRQLLAEERAAREASTSREAALADILALINASAGDPQPVFEAILEKAHSLCEATVGSLQVTDGELFRAVATRGMDDEFADFLRSGYKGRDLFTRERTVQIMDMAELAREEPDDPILRAAADRMRTLLCLPLIKDGRFLGRLFAGRHDVCLFTEKQVGLLESFAAQAVIAMENARLMSEQRDALERQTAAAEVLEIINLNPGNLQPVFDLIIEKSVKLSGCEFGVLNSFDGRYFFTKSHFNAHKLWEQNQSRKLRAEHGNALERLVQGDDVVHVRDMRDGHIYDASELRRKFVDVTGARTAIWIALRKHKELFGALVFFRNSVDPFTDQQVTLLQSFAAQTVIAMESARLLSELRQRSEEVSELNRDLEERVAEQVEELGRVSRLKRFLAPQLAELIVSQGDEKLLDSHRRDIVVVFCDLRGYTAFTETAEPEEVLDFLREYHGVLGPIVTEYEGTLDQFSGDGIMVFFNDPVPIPAPAERAVKMAMAMRAAAGRITIAWRERGCELGFGIGVAQGYATLGQIGFSERAGYTAIGTVCNIAARLCDVAEDGQILLSQRVNAALNKTIATDQVGPLDLKGLTRPVLAFNVSANKPS